MSKLSTQIQSGDEAQEKILRGVKAVANVVGSTMGYRGNLVLLETQGGLPKPTKDGWEVAESIFLQDNLEALACESAKEAARKTAENAGDATTATMVLLDAFLSSSINAIKDGESQITVASKIEESKKLILEHLDKISTPITPELIYHVAKTSANGDEFIAKIVSDAYEKAGNNGSVGHTLSNNDDTFVDFVDGTLVERGYSDERFSNVMSNLTVLFEEEPLILISDINFQTVRQIAPFLDYAAQHKKELLIISDMDYKVEAVILENKVKHGYRFAVVKPPAIGKKRTEYLSDLAIVCNTQCVDALSGTDFVGRAEQFLGQCKTILSTKDNTIVTKHDDLDPTPIQAKINELKDLLKETENKVAIQNIEDRIAKLSGMTAIVKVGGITPSEVEERVARVDDAIKAVRSAKEEGVVAGGGMALHNCYEVLGDKLDEVSKMSILAPLFRILSNADVVETPELSYPYGYDVKSFQKVNMIEQGIVDATKCIKNAVENAISTSNTLSRCANAITLNR